MFIVQAGRRIRTSWVYWALRRTVGLHTDAHYLPVLAHILFG